MSVKGKGLYGWRRWSRNRTYGRVTLMTLGQDFHTTATEERPPCINEQESGQVLYRVQVRLDGEKLSTRMTEIWEWLDYRQVEPPVFRYRMTAEDIVLRLDFKLLKDAAAFGEAFHGVVLGIT